MLQRGFLSYILVFTLTLFLSLASLVGCNQKRYIYLEKDYLPEGQPVPLANFKKNADRITIMTWNVENLFDTVDDPDKDDDTFLPLAIKHTLPYHEKRCQKKGAYSWIQQCLHWDWNESVLQTKLSKLATVIRAVNSGKGPDVLVVQEVENIDVLHMLVDGYLQDLGYSVYLLENDDYRGIDVGLITRLPLKNEVSLKPMRSRPALSARLELTDGSILNFFGVHLPISPTPIEKRLEMVNNLKKFADLHPDELTIAAGDFNFPYSYDQQFDITNSYLKPNWAVSHLYCKSCYGSYFDSYNSEWSFLEMILLSKNFFSKSARWTLDPKSVQIFNKLPFQLAPDESPADFNLPEIDGVSDHWPLVIQIVRTQ
jgi:hypothetical protein